MSYILRRLAALQHIAMQHGAMQHDMMFHVEHSKPYGAMQHKYIYFL
jgi:hypothetical protein